MQILENLITHNVILIKIILMTTNFNDERVVLNKDVRERVLDT